MEIQVYDTYVKRNDGVEMHFDVFINKDGGTIKKALEDAKKYLDSVGETEAKITSDECRFCHIQSPTDEQIKAINENGYFIYKMSNCP